MDFHGRAPVTVAPIGNTEAACLLECNPLFSTLCRPLAYTFTMMVARFNKDGSKVGGGSNTPVFLFAANLESALYISWPHSESAKTEGFGSFWEVL